ncbi:hypothetical protein OXX80_000414 [Metschnikowia pulcherrima]
MRALFLLSYSASLFLRVKSIPVGVTPDGGDESGGSNLQVPKADVADILTDEQVVEGYANIDLVKVSPPPSFLFEFPKEERDYSIDPKFVTFFQSLHGLVKGTTFDGEKYKSVAEDLKAQYASLKELGSAETATTGVTEMLNTTAYYYRLMRYRQELVKKDENKEFDEHDSKCVFLFMDQLELEISLLGFLSYDQAFSLDKSGDPVETFKAAKERAKELELQLGRLFLERSQVFEYDIRAFTRISGLMKKLEKFVSDGTGVAAPLAPGSNTPLSDASGSENPDALAEGLKDEAAKEDSTIQARSLRGVGDDDTFQDNHLSESQNFEKLKIFMSQLEELHEKAPTMNTSQLKKEVDDINEVFREINVHSVRWSKLAVPEVTELYAQLQDALVRLDDLDEIYLTKQMRDDDSRDYDISGESETPSFDETARREGIVQY